MSAHRLLLRSLRLLSTLLSRSFSFSCVLQVAFGLQRSDRIEVRNTGQLELARVVAVEFLVGDFGEHRQARGLDDRDQPRALVELHVIAVDDDRVRITRREPPKLGVDQPEAPHHVLGALVRPISLSDVLLDRIGVRREDNDSIRIPRVANRQHLAEIRVVLRRVLGDVRLERDACTLEEDDFARTIAVAGISIVRVVETGEVGGHSDGVAARVDIFEDPRIPDAFFTLSIGRVVIQVSELPDERALADARPADDRHAHARSFYVETEAVAAGCPISTTGRTSMVPTFADGIRAAMPMASSRSFASTR